MPRTTERLNRVEWRSPDVVMDPRRVGAARLTRYSFNRTLLRRVAAEGWKVTRDRFELDVDGCGHAVYRVDAIGYEFNFVAFTTTLDEAEHSDRVVAEAWEITGVLVEGPVDDVFLAELCELVPLQERARFDPRVLVLTRGNRSVRFYDYLVDCLASGEQPDPDRVADAGYIMRSTAFYGNGKFGMRSFLGYGDGHPLAVPYRAQMLAAWLFRELSYDSVEHAAQAHGGDEAVGFDDEWRTYFGLGNATGLGLVPYFMKHPRVVATWFELREAALHRVRCRRGDAESIEQLGRWIVRATQHFAHLGDDDRSPWCCPTQIAERSELIAQRWNEVARDEYPFDALYRWAHEHDVETCELAVSLLVELDGVDVDVAVTSRDDLADASLMAEESNDFALTTPSAEVRRLLDDRFGWTAGLGLRDAEASGYWWVVSDNTEEPRRVDPARMAPERRSSLSRVGIDVAHQIEALRAALDMDAADREGGLGRIGDFLVCHPEHRLAVSRVFGAESRYGELRDNPCAHSFLPLETQRFQLAMYGMDNFSPKSTDWLRVTLNQGAPRAKLTDADKASASADDWIWPVRPGGTETQR